MTDDVRGDPHALDAAWMTQALEESGVARGATVTALDIESFIGTGQMGRNVRYALTWDDPAGRPASVVGKFPTDDPTTRANGFANGNYQKEWAFYRLLRPTVGVRSPEAYVARLDETAPDFVLILEDLRDSAQGDQLAGLHADQAALAVEQAVAFHAPRWGDDSLLALLGTSPEEAAAMVGGLYTMTLPGTLARIGHHLDADGVGLVEAFAPLVSRWVSGIGSPSTLVHMDFRPDNLLFGRTADAPPVVVIDWQTISYGPGANDIAYLIGGAFEPAERARVERALVADYAERLQAAGIEYPREDAWRDYRLGSLWGVAMSIIATMLAEQTERGDAMLGTMLRRHAHHARDLDALSLLA
jgi:hypothetical protein